MSRLDCISNRNIKIIATYVHSKLGTTYPLLEGLPYPTDEYHSPEDFFLHEDEWTTYENFRQVFRRAEELVDEPYFSFNCGASSTRLRSLGRFHHLVKFIATPSDGFKRLPFFNKNFNDTKEIEIIVPPVYDRHLKKNRILLKVQFHKDIDPHQDYIGDPYLRGLISSIPTIWGLAPASIKQPLNPYNPEVLFNQEPDFLPYALDVKIEEDILTLRDPNRRERRKAGKKVILEAEEINGQEVYLGKYSQCEFCAPNGGDKREAFLITDTIKSGDRILLKAGEIFMAPYFILDILYERMSFRQRFSMICKVRGDHEGSGGELIKTIDQLRKSIEAKNKAYRALEKSNAELKGAKDQLKGYAQRLEHKVEERTAALRKAQKDLLQLNRSLESKVESQIVELEKYNELRRYLSPKLTEKILAGTHAFGAEPQRKTMSVVFTDIRGFSDLTDSLEPEEIFCLLDRYLSEMIKIIHHYDGTLNKIIGDGLLIFFGDPILMEDHATRSVRMAIDMQNKAAELRDEWLQYGHELAIGIGVNTGFMTVGNIGSDMHRDYTVIGSQVNVAARLESLAKAGQILISQRTYSKIKDLVEVEEMGKIKVKGIHKPVRAYNVIW
jgi:class 3 adenylate cyclase